MNYQALRNELLGDPLYSPWVVTNDMPKQNAYPKDKALSDMLNAEQGTRLVEHKINAIRLMAELGTESAIAILLKLENAEATNAALKYVLIALNSDRGIDIGHHETLVTLDKLVQSAVLMQADVDAIKDLAVKPSSRAMDLFGQPVTAADVSIALRFNAEFQGV